ncbi:MAG: tyrosine-type recombinase/integrase, partial [Candidatus Omnitrophica bacterium]|nr:tyrosine-type recombinase/integrase [Candidatus Omnitrophota bacterium]
MQKTLINVYQEFIMYHQWEKSSRPATLAWHKKNSEAFISYVSDLYKQPDPALNTFNEDNIRNYLIKRVKQDKVAPRTVLWHWQAYRAFATFLIRRKFIKVDPMLNVTRPKVERKLPTYLSETEIKTLLKYMASHKKQRYYLGHLRDMAIIGTLLFTGVRRGELLNLKMEDVDLENDVIRLLQTKSRRQEVVPINSTLKPILTNYIAYRQRFDRPTTHLFIDVNRSGWDKRRGQGNFGSRGIQLLFNEINKTVKFNCKVTPHVLRRTFGTII